VGDEGDGGEGGETAASARAAGRSSSARTMANGGENMVVRRREQTQGLIHLARISSPVTQPSQGRPQKWILSETA
jgi:hypothetical protein